MLNSPSVFDVYARLCVTKENSHCVELSPSVFAVYARLCVTKENSRRVELYSVHTNPFKSFEFCVAGRDHFVRFVYVFAS